MADKCKALVNGLLKEVNIMKWEAFSMAAVVWFQCNYGQAHSLGIYIITACMWLIAGGSADVHIVVTLYKTIVTGSIPIYEGIARMVAQVGGGFLGALMMIIFDKRAVLSGYPAAMQNSIPPGTDDIVVFLEEAMATAVVLLVFNKIMSGESDEVAAFGYAAILYAFDGYLTNPARIVGPTILKPGGFDDFDSVWPQWFGPLFGAPLYGVLAWILTGEKPALFEWIAVKFGCKCCISGNADAGADAA